MWEYDDRAACEQIDAAVRRDPDSRRAQDRRAGLPPMFRGREETFMTATAPLNQSPGGPPDSTAG